MILILKFMCVIEAMFLLVEIVLTKIDMSMKLFNFFYNNYVWLNGAII